MLAVIVASFLAGALARRALESRADGGGSLGALVPVLERYVVYVALPALVVSRMSRASFGAETLVPAGAAWLAMGLSAVVIWSVARGAGWRREVTGAALLVGVMGNTSFLGLGVVGSLLGQRHLAPAIAYDQLGSFLALATYGALVASWYGTGGRGWRPMLRRLSTFPPFLALLASPLVGIMDPPPLVFGLLDAPGSTVGAVAMFALGTRVARPGHLLSGRGSVAIVLSVKMILGPIVVVIAATAFGAMGSIPWEAAILQAAAPPMVTAALVAVSAHLDTDTAMGAVIAGTFSSVLSLPLWWLIAR